MSGSTSPTGLTPTSPVTSPCCEGGRPVVTDPVTGQSVCSCQYDPSRLALSSYPRLTPYGPSPYAPPTEQNPYPTLESSAFYSPLGGAYAGLKEGSGTGDAVSCWSNHGTLSNGYYSYDPTFAAAYGYGGGYDLAARRKNATRESTATLKAWLSEHKKNPYPTKGEKIMLAIITKMTLTQVSTWFANARRRLKKENKMTWEPKNKTEDDDDDIKDDDDDDNSSTAPISSPGSNNNTIGIKMDSSSDLKSDCSAASNKPKIWSLADTAACKTPPPSSHFAHLPHHPHHNQYSHHHHLQQSNGGSHLLGGPQMSHSHHGQVGMGGPVGNMGGPPSGGGPPPPPAVSSAAWSFSLPAYGRYGGFHIPPPTSSGGGGGGSNGEATGVGTDTPPQTPPNLKVPLLPGSLSHFASPPGGPGSHPHHHPALVQVHPANHHHHPHHPSAGLGPHGSDLSVATAFKPVLKSSSGGFCM